MIELMNVNAAPLVCIATTFVFTPRPICCLRCARQCACANCRSYVASRVGTDSPHVCGVESADIEVAEAPRANAVPGRGHRHLWRQR